MGHQQQGDGVTLGQLQQQVLQFHPGERVHRAKRFVEQQHVGSRVEAASDGDPLRHAAGEHLGQGLGEPGEADFIDQCDPGLVVAVVGAETDVLLDGQPGHQSRLLKHERREYRRLCAMSWRSRVLKVSMPKTLQMGVAVKTVCRLTVVG